MLKDSPNSPSAEALSPSMRRVLQSAAELQKMVPDAVLVGGSAAVLYAVHRESFDHDHVLVDLDQRYDLVLDAIEASDGWATSVRASSPPMTILGSLDGIEAGLRKLRRKVPLEITKVSIDPAHTVVVPSADEILRIKGYLVVQRNQVRDYLDVVALTDKRGVASAAAVLHNIDAYYSDRSGGDEGSVLTQLILALSDPSPRDAEVIRELDRYKGLAKRWQDWGNVREHCLQLSLALSGDLT